MILRLMLPWPPSVNRYWRNVKGRTLISREGRNYRGDVAVVALKAQRFGSVPVSVSIWAYPPDNRRRDLDNLLKAPLDALTYAGVWDDDSQICDLSIRRCDKSGAGHLVVDVRSEAVARYVATGHPLEIA